MMKFCQGLVCSLFWMEKKEIVVSGIFGEAEEALHFLEENVVDIVLTDIEMAEMDGLSFIREIRAETGWHQGVIIVSCHEDFSYAQTGDLAWDRQLYPEAESDGEDVDSGSEKCI